MLLSIIPIAFILLFVTPSPSLGDSHHASLQPLRIPEGARILPPFQLRTKRQSSWEGADSCSHAFHSYLCRRKGKVPTSPIVQERPGSESRPDVVKTRPITFAPVIPKTTRAPTTPPPLPPKPKEEPILEGSLSSPHAIKPPEDPVKTTTKAPSCSGPLLSPLCTTTTQKPFKDPEFAQPTFLDPALTKPKVNEKVPPVQPAPSLLDPSQTKQVPNRKIPPPRESVPAATNVQHTKKDMCSHPFHSFLCNPRGTRRRIIFTGKPRVPIPNDPDNSLSGDASNPYGELVDPIFRQTTTTPKPTTTTLKPIVYTLPPTTTTTRRPTTTSTTPRPPPPIYTTRTTPKPTTFFYRTTTTTTPRPTTTTTTFRPTYTTPRPTTTTPKPTTTTPRPTTTTYRPTTTTRRPTTTTTTLPPPIPLDTQEARSPFNAVQLPKDPGPRESWTGDSCKHSFHSYLCSPTKGRRNRFRFGGQEETRPRPQFIPPPIQKITTTVPTTTSTTPPPYRKPTPDPKPAPSGFGELLLPLFVTTTTTKGPCVVGDPRPECDPSLTGDASSPSQSGIKLPPPPPPVPPRRPPPPPVRPPAPLPPVQPPPPLPPPRRPPVRPPPPVPSKAPAFLPPPPRPPPVQVNALPPVPAEFVRGPAATDIVESNALPSSSCAHAFHSHLCRSTSIRSRRKRPFGR